MSLTPELTRKILEDVDHAPIDEKLRATLLMLRKMTLDPASFGPDDVRAVLSLGVSRQAVAEAMYVAYLFNVYDRLADTLGWDVPAQQAYYDGAAQNLLKRGYLL